MKKHLKTIGIITGIIVAVTAIVAVLVNYVVLSFSKTTQVETRYTAILDQLLNSPQDKQISSAMAQQLFEDLSKQIENKSPQDLSERQKLRNEVASKLSTRFQETSFDLGRSSNLELEITSIRSWQEYPDLLEKNSTANINIIYKYHQALTALREKEMDFVKSASLQKNGLTESNSAPKDKYNGTLFRDLNFGYKKHIEFLRKDLSKSQNTVNKEYLLLSFCWYYQATNNQALTKSIFDYDESQFSFEKGRCEEKHL